MILDFWPPDLEDNTFLLLKPPACGALLRWPQDTSTAGRGQSFSFLLGLRGPGWEPLGFQGPGKGQGWTLGQPKSKGFHHWCCCKLLRIAQLSRLNNSTEITEMFAAGHF